MNFDANTLQRVPTPAEHSTTETRAPERRTFLQKLWPKDFWAKFAISWGLSQCLIVSILEIIVLVLHRSTIATIETTIAAQGLGSGTTEVIGNAFAITVYHVLFVIAQAFQFLLCMDAVVNSSLIQLVSTLLFNLCCLAYSVLQTRQAQETYFERLAVDPTVTQLVSSNVLVYTPHPTRMYEMIIIFLMAIFCIGWIVITQRLYKVFGWSIFKELGADIAVRNRLKLFHIYIMLLKLDVFFLTGFSIQYLVLVTLQSGTNNQTDFWIHVAVAIPVNLGLLILGYYAVTRESNIMMSLMLVGLSGGIAYLVSKLVDIYTTEDPKKYASSMRSLTFFESITLALCIATFVLAILCFRNFGKGLMDQLRRKQNRKGHVELNELGSQENGGAPKDKRWMIE
ncbi:hypothetical protein HK102_004752 [Quaeritorhiza haematococci]|nr:hypothetical protein HK102_004752 [Quaeritorhiza haematococci]